MTDEPTMSTADVARKLGVTRQTVSRWIRDGRLRAVRIAVGRAGETGRTAEPSRSIYRIRPSAFAAFVRRYVTDE